MKKYLKKFVGIAAALALLCTGCSRQPTAYQSMDTAMGTIISQTIYTSANEETAGEILGEVISCIDDLEANNLSWRLETSEIYQINAGAGSGQEVEISDLLTNVLKYHPFLIKPNNHELGEIFGVTLNTREEVIPYARKLQEQGAKNVLVSMAGEGAVLLAENGRVYTSEAPKGKVLNSVGAGDSMVAGFIAGFLASGDYEQAFYMGVCTGSASAFSENMATKEEIKVLLNQLGKDYIR